jgi:hypothetical protein
LRVGRGIVLAASAFLGGCTSIGAMQTPITRADVTADLFCPTQAEVDALPDPGPGRGARRNWLVAICIKAINRRYETFKAQLHQESTGFNLFTDIAALAATTGASIATGKTAQRLSAGGAFLIGTGTAVNKDVFYQQALPAIEAAMDARRDRVLQSIFQAENGDPNGIVYGLDRAAIDLDALQAAGNLYGAISELTKSANLAAADAAKQRSASEQGLEIVEPQLLSDSLADRTSRLIDFVQGLTGPGDRARLEGVARALGIVPQPNETFDNLQARVKGQIFTRATVAPDRQEAAVQELEARVNPFMGGSPR